MTIDLPRNYYRVLNSPAPGRWRVVATVAAIVLAALAFGLVG
jgi:hypothetical protein